VPKGVQPRAKAAQARLFDLNKLPLLHQPELNGNTAADGCGDAPSVLSKFALSVLDGIS
jgi:hypothetical protein